MVGHASFGPLVLSSHNYVNLLPLFELPQYSAWCLPLITPFPGLPFLSSPLLPSFANGILHLDLHSNHLCRQFLLLHSGAPHLSPVLPFRLQLILGDKLISACLLTKV